MVWAGQDGVQLLFASAAQLPVNALESTEVEQAAGHGCLVGHDDAEEARLSESSQLPGHVRWDRLQLLRSGDVAALHIEHAIPVEEDGPLASLLSRASATQRLVSSCGSPGRFWKVPFGKSFT